jgi:hypothetical protein
MDDEKIENVFENAEIKINLIWEKKHLAKAGGK